MPESLQETPYDIHLQKCPIGGPQEILPNILYVLLQKCQRKETQMKKYGNRLHKAVAESEIADLYTI